MAIIPYCKHCDAFFEGGTPLFWCIYCKRPLIIAEVADDDDLCDRTRSIVEWRPVMPATQK